MFGCVRPILLLMLALCLSLPLVACDDDDDDDTIANDDDTDQPDDDDTTPPPFDGGTWENEDLTLTIGCDPLTLTVKRGEEVLMSSQTPLFSRADIADKHPTTFEDPSKDPAGTTWTDQTCADIGDRLRVETDDVYGFRVFLDYEDDQPDMFALRLERGEESIFGTGESFDHTNFKGQSKKIYFEVTFAWESGFNETHYPIPFVMTTAGYGILVNNLQAQFFDFTEDGLSRLVISRPQTIEYALLFERPDDRWSVYEDYIDLTGTPRIAPEWALEPQFWRDENHDEQGIYDDMQAIRDNEIPGSLIWIDNPWMDTYSNFEFCSTFPDPQRLLDDMEANGFKTIVWSVPQQNPPEDDGYRSCMRPNDTGLFEEGVENGYYIKNSNDEPFMLPGVGVSAHPDFTNPEAVDWWQGLLHKVIDMGVEGFKIDYGEGIVVSLAGVKSKFVFSDGSTQETMSRHFCTLTSKTYIEALEERGVEGFLITRCGGLGAQQYTTCVWPGDLDNDFTFAGTPTGEGGALNTGGLPAAINGALGLSVAGFPTFGSDIGGYRTGEAEPSSQPRKKVLLRWAQFQTWLPVMQLGGGGRHHGPWSGEYDQETLEIYKKFAQIHSDLIPYFQQLLENADEEPLLRPIGLQYPHDPKAQQAQYQFFVGDDIMVAPIFEESNDPGSDTREVYLPPGTWTPWFYHGFEYQSDVGDFLEFEVPLDEFLVFKRSGAEIPMRSRQ